jgi:micrococcal nuclease
VTNTGSKYHLENCSFLAQSKLALPLQEAARRGYEPCAVCNPPGRDRASPVLPENAGSPEIPADPARQGGLYHVAGLYSYAQADMGRMIRAEVSGYVDGDTVKLRIENPPPELSASETVRLLGVDTPETVHPSRPVESFGKEAGDFTRDRLLGKTVYLAFDWDLRDRYGRLLAYIYTAGAGGGGSADAAPAAPADGGPAQDSAAGRISCHNADLIREGYGHAYTRYAFQFMEEFRALEQEARREKRGLWGE